MTKRELIRQRLVKWVCGLFSVYWIITLLSVLCLERETLIWKRGYAGNNLLPMLAALAMLAVLGRIAASGMGRSLERMPEKRFFALLAAASLAVLAVQMTCLTQIDKQLGMDFMYVRDAAGSIGLHHTMVHAWYFNKYPNNQPITFLFAMLMRVFGKWSVVTAGGVLLINLSVLLTAQMACRLSGSRRIGLFTFAVGVLLVDFSFRTFVPYTDNSCVFFMVLPLAIMVNGKRGAGWLCLAAASTALACFIKITAAIPLIAGVIMLALVRLPDWRRTLARSALFVCVLVCTFGALTACKDGCFRDAGFVKNTRGGAGAWHYFMMGQNDEHWGAYLEDDVRTTMGFGTQKERDSANRAEGLRRIRARGLAGNLRFYAYKNDHNYGDGTFAPYQQTIKADHFGDSFWEQIMIDGKPYYQHYALAEQALWLLVMCCILCEALLRAGREKPWVFLKLVILSVSLYLMLFEGSAKYIYMFLPFYLLLAGAGLRALLDRAGGREKQN